jgi:hypothetical protein
MSFKAIVNKTLALHHWTFWKRLTLTLKRAPKHCALTDRIQAHNYQPPSLPKNRNALIAIKAVNLMCRTAPTTIYTNSTFWPFNFTTRLFISPILHLSLYASIHTGT